MSNLPYPGHVLKRGSVEQAVKTVQQFINGLSRAYPRHYRHLAEDGIYGQDTSMAVLVFQKRHRLHPDGQVGAVTWRAMFGTGGPLPKVHPPGQASTRDKCLAYARSFDGVHEIPAGSNLGPHILAWQRHTARGARYLDGAPWCGIFDENMLSHVGVNTTPRMASVGMIEDDAKAGRFCYRGWHAGAEFHGVLHGDLVVMFGYGIHVELLDEVDYDIKAVHTVGGNTSSGVAGSQSNGGRVARRTRSFSDVHGIALINFPG